ncbi:hypothetical protein [Amycolatopsis rifamycinica]|uniref:Resolvase/invertase-type recombinase catalytic domain-containing protein n=1 Tax=Amycolatopsis rifamycinica TaxID=287986 RepID=A0A066UG16_9PSEU|nr:hypothetical protein [Amycolatopsis rifamycinica]KDN23143.1 hypothetical protein DV20_05345 [Amycolatopsis rifamycinica]
MELLDRPLIAEGRTGQLAYGYMKVPRDIEDEKVRVMEIRMRAYATDLGLTFSDFFYEFSCGSLTVFDEMIEELVVKGARYVIVPTLRHFARHRLLQEQMIARVYRLANAEVLDLSAYER